MVRRQPQSGGIVHTTYVPTLAIQRHTTHHNQQPTNPRGRRRRRRHTHHLVISPTAHAWSQLAELPQQCYACKYYYGPPQPPCIVNLALAGRRGGGERTANFTSMALLVVVHYAFSPPPLSLSPYVAAWRMMAGWHRQQQSTTAQPKPKKNHKMGRPSLSFSHT